MTRTTRILSSVIMLFALLVGSTPAEAQGGRGGGRGGPGGAVRLPQMIDVALEHREDLGLNDATVEALRELRPVVTEAFEPYQSRLQSARGGGDRSAMRALFQEIGEALEPYQKRFDAIVTEEQRTELNQFMPQRGGRRGG